MYMNPDDKHGTSREQELMSDYISLPLLCKELNISQATGRNWVRLGKLHPSVVRDGEPLFARDYPERMKEDLRSGKNPALKKRRNKKYAAGNEIYRSYLPAGSQNLPAVRKLAALTESGSIPVNDRVLCAVLGECALQLIMYRKTGRKKAGLLSAYLNNEIETEYSFLIDDLLDMVSDEDSSDGSVRRVRSVPEEYPEFFSEEFVYEEGEDLPGLIYLSLKNIGSRKASGSYYTPVSVVKKLCHRLFDGEEKKAACALAGSGESIRILDPACGTGNFILHLPSFISPEEVYGIDTDPFSIRIARINYALKYEITDPLMIRSHIIEGDFLAAGPAGSLVGKLDKVSTEEKTGQDDKNDKGSTDEKTDPDDKNDKGDKGDENDIGYDRFDFIIGNPPWGGDFTESQQTFIKERYETARAGKADTGDVFVEQALSWLKPGGVLSFVLPEAILNVRAHRPVRRILLDRCSIRYLEYLGNAFDKVQCPCLILEAVLTGQPFQTKGLLVCDGRGKDKRLYKIGKNRKIDIDCLNLSVTDEEYDLLHKMDRLPGKMTLSGRASFALGIVTGNNKEMISRQKEPDQEIVLKGSDIRRYHYRPSGNYLAYRPERFQQSAPEACYRAPEKLLYRFVCNQPVFAYDNRQTLSLNSCNILIPGIPGTDIKYILAILNSRPVQFYFQKKYHSVKVLRSHLESIPLPSASPEVQREIVAAADSILMSDSGDVIAEYYEKLDGMIADLYGFSEEEYDLVRRAVKDEKKYI